MFPNQAFDWSLFLSQEREVSCGQHQCSSVSGPAWSRPEHAALESFLTPEGSQLETCSCGINLSTFCLPPHVRVLCQKMSLFGQKSWKARRLLHGYLTTPPKTADLRGQGNSTNVRQLKGRVLVNHSVLLVNHFISQLSDNTESR